MRTTIFLSTLYLVFGFFACKKDDAGQTAQPVNWTNRITELYNHNGTKVQIDEGVAGTLTMKDGNCMPVVGPGSTCREYPVVRRLRIYEATQGTQVQQDREGYYTRVDSRLIAIINTDEEGFFQCRLAPGTYSLFIEEKNRLYARDMNGSLINTVIVALQAVSVNNQRVDYASY